jgi:hypothetical protein
MQLGISTDKGRSFATIGERVMTEEDEAFNDIERRSIAKKEAVRAQLTPLACERCKQLEEQVYDLLGRLQAVNLGMAMLRQADQFKEKNT